MGNVLLYASLNVSWGDWLGIVKEAKMANGTHEMIRGMGTAVRFIAFLLEDLEKKGGRPEMVHFMATERGKKNRESVAEFIANLKWAVPKSLIMELAYKLSRREHGAHGAQLDKQFRWEPALDELNIPYVCFGDPVEIEGEDVLWPVPPELREQLHGKPVTPGMLIEWHGEPGIVAGIDFGRSPQLGEIIDMHKLLFLHIVSLEHIDPDS